jgi:hypothetical protein
MDGFTKNPKMQCFKEGGSVKYESRKEHKEEVAADINQDKKIVKKAFKMHDTQSHEGEKTNLSKLKNGGRAKKETGTVKKYDKASGQYGAKKTAADNKNIQQAKQFKVKKLADGGALSGLGAVTDYERSQLEKMVRPSRKGQGAVSEVEKRAMAQDVVSDNEKQRQMDRIKRAQKYLGPAQQGQFSEQESSFLGRKKGGKVKKMNTGGTCS